MADRARRARTRRRLALPAALVRTALLPAGLMLAGVMLAGPMLPGWAVPPAAADAPATPAFKRLDRNADGAVTFAEFVQTSDERLAGMDRNGDGDIGRDEFMAYHEAIERRRVDRVFALLDRGHTGRLTVARLRGPEARRLARCDRDKNGTLTHAEYLDCRRRLADRWRQRIFARYDSNGDGFIGRDERVAALRDFFARLDADGDGRVTRAEFAAAEKRWQARRSRPAQPPAGTLSQPLDDLDGPP